MSPGEDADPYHIDVLLYGGGHYVFRPAMQSRVDHFHPGVAQSTRDDFGTTIMSIEAYLGDQNANRSVSLCHTSPPLIPRTQDYRSQRYSTNSNASGANGYPVTRTGARYLSRMLVP